MSKPTNSPKPKRVVSKAEYRRYLAKRSKILAAWGLSVGMLMYVLHEQLSIPFTDKRAKFVIASFVIALSVSIYSFKRMQKAIEQIEPVEPISPRNIDRLPPADALVRGSDAPQTPEVVLLRAAQEQETPQEQLLRAAE